MARHKFTRQLEQVQHEQYAPLRYTAWDWAALTSYGTEAKIYGLAKEPSRWSIGLLMKSSRDAQLDAVKLFKDGALIMHKIVSDNDLSKAGKERRALDTLAAAAAQMGESVKKMDDDLADIFDKLKAGMLPVEPLAPGDMIGELRDQEVRRYLLDTEAQDRLNLLAEMAKGKHPALVAAVLRSPSPLLSGLKPEQVIRLEGAGIAAVYANDLRAVKEMIDAREDARVTCSRSANQLAAIGGLRAQEPAVTRLLQGAFMPSPVVAEFREWLSQIPVDLYPEAAEQAADAEQAA